MCRRGERTQSALAEFLRKLLSNKILGYHVIFGRKKGGNDWLISSEQVSSLAARNKLKFNAGPAGNQLILDQDKCKHILDDLGR